MAGTARIVPPGGPHKRPAGVMPIPSDTFRQPVTGRNLRPGTLGDQLDAPATLVAFLRHLGCMFCREMVADLRAKADGGPFPPVLLVTQSPADELDAFFDGRWPKARAVADPARRLYGAFDIARASSFGTLVSPLTWTCAIRAAARGNLQAIKPPVGDPWLLSALFLIAPGGEILWECRAKHPGDRPDYGAVPSGTPCEIPKAP